MKQSRQEWRAFSTAVDRVLGVSTVTTVDRYVTELGAALHVRGAARRRLLRECRDHLADAAAERGEAEAVRAFGPAAEIAAGLDAEIAARRGVRSTFAAVRRARDRRLDARVDPRRLGERHRARVAGRSPSSSAAQVAGVAPDWRWCRRSCCAVRRRPPADVALLARRNGCALVAAGVTILSAGAAVPGRGSAVLILAGPLLVCAAMVAVLRARALARRLDGAGALAVRPPLEDLGRLAGLPFASLDARRLLLITTCIAAAAAFVRDRVEQGHVGEALVAAGIEGTAVVACFLVLGPALGLWHRS